MRTLLLRKELREPAQHRAHPLAPILRLPPFGMPNALAQVFPLIVGIRRNRDPSVLGLERVEALVLRHLVLELILGDEGVTDHRVAFDRELTYDVAAVILLEVDHEAALVAVEGKKGRGHAVLEGSAEAAGGIALRRLDFDHVGAQIAKQHRAKRSRHDLTKVQDTKACQWSFCHRFQPRACGHVPPRICLPPRLSPGTIPNDQCAKLDTYKASIKALKRAACSTC